ncbi:hypothetical protein ACQWFX_25625, partial [Salmonella enterica subsp. enterica serovar Infantis]
MVKKNRQLQHTGPRVGTKKNIQARAITKHTVRLVSGIYPLLGGIFVATGGVARNTGLEAAGTI